MLFRMIREIILIREIIYDQGNYNQILDMTHHFIKDQIMSKDISRITEVIQKSGHEQVPSTLVTTIKGLGKGMIINKG